MSSFFYVKYGFQSINLSIGNELSIPTSWLTTISILLDQSDFPHQNILSYIHLYIFFPKFNYCKEEICLENMGITTYDMEIETTVPAAKLYQAFILDGDTLVPKVVPQAMKSIEILEGDGGAGTIKLITFGEGKLLTSLQLFITINLYFIKKKYF
ncbi:hypothetical protein LXL04_015451 [Taraxacum kok-saghyz]